MIRDGKKVVLIGIVCIMENLFSPHHMFLLPPALPNSNRHADSFGYGIIFFTGEGLATSL